MSTIDEILSWADRLPRETVKAALIRRTLLDRLEDDEPVWCNADLNPQLSFGRLCDRIAERVTELGYECSERDVCVIWLTGLLTGDPAFAREKVRVIDV